MNFLLDSVILIDHFNNIEQASNFIAENINESYISVITRAELLTGFSKSELPLAKRLLDLFEVIPIEKSCADLAAKLRRDYKWKLPDAFQAAIAKQHQLKLVTRNTKDFDEKKHRFIKIPYQI